VEDMIRVLDSFIKQLIVNVLAQFFKHRQMHCVVSASFRPAKESINSLPIRSFGKSSPSTGCTGEFNNNDSPKIVCIAVSHIPGHGLLTNAEHTSFVSKT